MIHKMFVIYDSKANAYMQPWFLTQNGMAVRAFSDCVNSDDHNFSRHPEDYTLFSLGEFDDQTAKITRAEPISLGNGVQYKKTIQQTDMFNAEVFHEDIYHTRENIEKRKLTDGEDQ